MFTIVGLGNPGVEYENTRHNAGREILKIISKKEGFSEWKEEGKLKALLSAGKIGKNKVQLVLPNNMMNNSGASVVPIIKSKKDLAQLVVIYDDMDLPMGKIKISHNRSSGGHRGLESIIKKLKSEEFTRIRVGISVATPSGKIKKPKGEKAVIQYLMSPMKDKELTELKKTSKTISLALDTFMTSGLQSAMTNFNS
ncbi:MAG TPA: aminoacyl-tRNA hydrolase [Candidatus Paceibacterota bacterium]